MTSPTTASPRALLAALHQAAVQGAAPFARTKSAVEQWCRVHPADPGVPVHVVALGKASVAMMHGAVAGLRSGGMETVRGIGICAENPSEIAWPAELPRTSIAFHRGDHPVPGPASLEAAERVEDFLQEIEPGARAIVLVSGGATALSAAPIARLSQEAGDAERAQALLANLAQTLLESGLAIHEMNAIRRRVLRFGAGRLAVALAKRGVSQIATFAISDVIGDDPAVIGSGPCTPDPLDDAALLALLDAHDLRSQLQRATATVLGLEGGMPPVAVPRADDPAFARVAYTLVARNRDALEAMAAMGQTYGCRVILDDVPLEGPAMALGEALVRRALTLAREIRPGEPVLLLCGGEPVVHLRDMVAQAIQEGDADEPLRGGRMQLLALAAALALEEAAMQGHPDTWRITLLGAGTDGRDGPTDAAGAIVDAAVPALARRAQRAPERDLMTGHSWFSLQEAGALLRTGLTGTNAMDVVALLIR